MTSDPDGKTHRNNEHTVNPSGSGGPPQNSGEPNRGESTEPPTQTGFDETVFQGSQFTDLTEQVAPGAMLGQFGRYMIQGKLGEGGMGAVYIARDTQLDRDIALKIPKFRPDDKVSIEWFFREARSMATVHHPNLCPVYDVGVIGGIHYMSMAYIEGRPLTDYVKSDKPIQARQVAAVVRKIALALEEAHQAGIVHRDLKPDNIMINIRKEPVIMDFGLARRESINEAQLTKTGQVMGTPSYMAPEQVEGNNALIGPRTDIYSLGVMMYQMLCGELPFKGVVTLVLAKIITEEPPAPSTIKADVDPALERICLKAKHRDPDQRHQTAAELARDLKEYLSGSSSGDTIRRAKTAAETDAAELTQTDQLANEYFDASPAPYSWNESTGDVSPTDEGVVSRSKERHGLTRKNVSIDPLWQKMCWVSAVCLVGTVLFYSLGGGGDAPEPSPGVVTGTDRIPSSKAGDNKTASLRPPEGGTPAAAESIPEDYKLAMNGRSSYVNLPMKFDGSHPLTIEAIVHRQGDLSRPAHFVSDIEAAGVGLLFQEGEWRFVVRHESGYTMARAVAGETVGQRIHLAGVLENGSVRLYVNGEQKDEQSTSENFVPSPTNLVIGANPGDNTSASAASKSGDNSYYQFFRGTLDEIRISSVARYASDFVPGDKQFEADTATLALYHCDDVSGGTLTDSSSNGNDGQVRDCRLVEASSFESAPNIRRAPYVAAVASQQQEIWAKNTGIDLDWENSIGMRMRLIPPGTFQRGTSQEDVSKAISDAKAKDASEVELATLERESPARTMTVPHAFYMGVYEVTRKDVNNVFGPDVTRTGEPNRPFSPVTGPQCMRLCNRLSEMEGRKPWYLFEGDKFVSMLDGNGYRLPTIAEWEYACCGGTEAARYFESISGRAEDYEWFGDKEQSEPHRCGQKLPNPFGLYDMLGNVREIVHPNDLKFDRKSVDVAGASWQDSLTRLRSASFGNPRSVVISNAGVRLVLPVAAPARIDSNNDVVELLPLVDVKRDALARDWSKSGTQLNLTEQDGMAYCALPAEIDGSYELTIDFVRLTRGGAVQVLLPVANTHAWFMLSTWHDEKLHTGVRTSGELDGLDISKTSTALNVLDGQRYVLNLSCVRSGQDVTIKATVDGLQLHERTLDVAELHKNDILATMPRGQPVLAIDASAIRYDSVQLLVLDGKAVLSPDAVPFARSNPTR